MTLSFSFNAENADDLQKILALIKEQGFDKFINQPKSERITTSPKREWKHIGIGNLGGILDNISRP
jgi:hypothetical protein